MIRICAYYYVHEDREGIGIRFDFSEYYSARPVCKIQLAEGITHRVGKVTVLSGAGSTIYLENKETLTIEVWVDDQIIGGGLYQVDTEYEDYEGYVLCCICSYGIELSQESGLEDIINYEHERLEDERKDILEGILASLEADEVSNELEDNML